MKKPKFNIGDYVEAVPSFLDYEGPEFLTKNTTIKLEKPRRGVVIGATYRFEGEFIPGRKVSQGYGWEENRESNQFIATKGVLFWQIREGFLNKPFEALEEDIKLIERVHFHCIRLGNSKGKDINNPVKIPWKNTGWTDWSRRALSEVMKNIFKENPEDFPRDSKGRFKKSS